MTQPTPFERLFCTQINAPESPMPAPIPLRRVDSDEPLPPRLGRDMTDALQHLARIARMAELMRLDAKARGDSTIAGDADAIRILANAALGALGARV